MPPRSEVIGSLLRPPELKQAMEQANGQPSEELRRLQDQAVLDAIRLQEDCGIDVITDGEMRRMYWFDPLTESLAGFSREATAPVPFTSGEGVSLEELKLPAVRSRLSIARNLPLEEVRYLREHSDSSFKATLPGLTYASVLWVPGVSDQVYPDREQYLREAVQLVKEMVGQLVEAGATYIQFDSPRYTHLVSEEGRANLRRVGLDPETWLGQMISLDNQVMEAFPGVTFGLHLCRGNHRSMWSVEGGYDEIAEQLFNAIAADRLMLEYDSPRSGSFAPLRFVPEGKTVVLGLITTKEPEVESADMLQQRLMDASQHIPLDRLALSPQCGFASTLPGNKVTEDVQRRKLALLGEVAREVWN
jgi:5-methyltetrahydropteroyltriglutamate--homocysteine methyltransferase